MLFKKWKLKAVIQKTISVLPAREKLNFIFQKYITKGVLLNDQHFGYKIEHSIDHLNYFKRFSQKADNAMLVELGSGWYPVVPIMMYLTNTAKVFSVDIQSWMSKKNHLICIEKFLEWKENGKMDQILDFTYEKRWLDLYSIVKNPENYSMQDINQIIGLKLLIQDARQLKIESATVDYICSNNTLEHIHKEELAGILKEFKRIIKKGGVMSHFIDMSDHFAHFDLSINIYNFLKYSPKKWKRIDNNIQPQNRLRFPQYLELYSQLKIPITETHTRKGNIEELKDIELHESFRKYKNEELAISHCYIVSQMN
jgi:SAM-dependent methyltransferase